MGTIPAYPTFTAGEIPTAAKLNQIAAAGNFWGLTPRCYAYNNFGPTIATGTGFSVVLLGAEIYDIVQAGDTEMHSITTNTSRITARTSGKWEISGSAEFANNATGIRSIAVRLNAGGVDGAGTLITSNSQTPVSGAVTSLALPVVELPLVAGDYVEMFVRQTSGGGLVLSAGQAQTFLRMKLTGS